MLRITWVAQKISEIKHENSFLSSEKENQIKNT